MTALLPVILVLAFAVGVWLFGRLPGPYAVLAVVVGGQMFLPEVQALPAVPDSPAPVMFPLIKLVKLNIISYALLAGSLYWDRRRWAAVKPRWFDLPMLAWCAAPFFSSFTNDLGLYDGGAESLQQTMVWGVPYWLGRLYLGNRAGLSAWAAAAVVGGVLYAPLCVVEARLSPQLHRWIYGFQQHSVAQSFRGSTFRPMVFMEHGLAVALWMATASLCAWWLWRNGAFRRFRYHPDRPPLPLGLVVAGLAAVTVLCRSTGALILGAGAGAALEAARLTRWRLPLLALLAVPPAFVTARYTEVWNAQGLVTLVREYVNADRAESLNFRLKNEYDLLAKAKERPAFGWGGHGRSRIKDERGNDQTIADSLWISAVGANGLFGLTAAMLVLVLPATRFVWRYPPRRWTPADAAAGAAVAALAIYACDHLFNAMVNPAFMLAAGGLAGATGPMAREPVSVPARPAAGTDAAALPAAGAARALPASAAPSA